MRVVSIAGAIVVGLLCPASALALDCPRPADQTQAAYATHAKAQLAKLGPLTGGSLDIKFKKTNDNLYAAYPHADRIVISQAVLSGACQIISSSKLSDEQKFKMWMQAASLAAKLK